MADAPSKKPLTPEEILALPEGTRLVVEITNPRLPEAGRRGVGRWDMDQAWIAVTMFDEGPTWRGHYEPEECDAWLAEDDNGSPSI